jgi:uncharacterized protein
METENTNYFDPAGTAEKDPFIAAAIEGKNSWWRYVILSVTPFLVSNTIGAIPLGIVIALSKIRGTLVFSGSMPDFESSGISLNLSFVLMVFPFILALLSIVFLMEPLHLRKFKTIINGGIPIRWSRIFTSAIVWLVISGLYLYLTIKADPSNYVINNTSKSLYIIAFLAIILIPFQAAFEEILFRGYLMQGFTILTKNRWMPMLITSLIFGLMHSFNPEMHAYGFWTMLPQYVFFGLVFAIPTMLDGGIEIAIGAHAANNIFLSVFLTTKASALQTPALYMQLTSYPWKEFAGLAASSFLFLAIIFFIYRWKDMSKLYAKVMTRKESISA